MQAVVRRECRSWLWATRREERAQNSWQDDKHSNAFLSHKGRRAHAHHQAALSGVKGRKKTKQKRDGGRRTADGRRQRQRRSGEVLREGVVLLHEAHKRPVHQLRDAEIHASCSSSSWGYWLNHWLTIFHSRLQTY